MISHQECHTCYGHPVRAIRRGHDVVFKACAKHEAERKGCPDCGDKWDMPEEGESQEESEHA